MLQNQQWLPPQLALFPVLCLFVFGNSSLYAQSVVEVAKLLASDGASDDRMGWSVDIDGDTAVVGAFFHDHQGVDSGAAYVFVRDGDTWTEQAELLPSDGKAGDQAGSNQIAVDGDTVLVGSHLHDDGVEDAGAVFIFERNDDAWVETGKIHANDRQPGDQFGVSVALDGETAIVGANGDDHPDGTQGSVYVFVRNGDTWTQQAKLVGSEIDVDHPGFAAVGISIEDDTVAIGAATTDMQGKDSGAVYIFVRNGTTWTQQARLLPSDGKREDQFGSYTALDNDTLIVGACRCHDSNIEGGAAYVYTRNGGIWTQQEKLSPGDGIPGDAFGVSLAIDGDRAVVGSSGGNQLGQGAGAAYVLMRNDNTWAIQEQFLASDGESQDNFGASVSMDEDSIVIGAWEAYQDDPEGMDTGSAYLFKLSSEFRINAGLNDAWFNMATSGQGLLITVFPDIMQMFLAWFTFDVERPPEDVTAFLGEPGHRWLTAQGPYEGDTATLTIFVTEGGVFDSPEPVAETDLDGDGTMILEFADCENGLVNYHIASLDISGEFPIERIATDNVVLCETLVTPE